MKAFNKKRLGVTVCLIFFVTGCSPFTENNLIEEIAPVIFWSIDKVEKDKLALSTLAPPLIKEKKQLLIKEVDLLKQGGKEFNLVYYRELKAGQLRMVFINEEIAKKGIMSILNTLLTDPDISQRIYLAIVKGKMDEYIRNQLDNQENLDYFLYRMFKHYEDQGEMSIINLHEFKNKLYSPLEDPFLPIFKIDKENFTYDGTAFFKEDKLINTVDVTKDQLFQLINNDFNLKHLTIPALKVSIGQVRAKVKIKLLPNLSAATFQVNVEGRLEEYRGDKNLSNANKLDELYREIESYLELETRKLLKIMQENQIDPVQIGSLTLHPFKKPMSKIEWMDHWEHMKIDAKYHLQIQVMQNVKSD